MCIPERGGRPRDLVIGDPVGFAVLVDLGTGKSRIIPEPEQFESLPVPIHDGLDEIKNPV